MYIDTHAHVQFDVFKDDADEVIRRALNNSTWMILVGSELKTSKQGLDYANKYEKGVYATVGLHPIHLKETLVEADGHKFVSRAEEFNYETYEKLAKFEKVVGIGEIGLDYYHINQHNAVTVKAKQKEVFVKLLELSRRLNFPAIIHCRQAHDDMLLLLKDFRKKYRDYILADKPWGVMHCFSGDEDLAWQYFSLGLIISFTGIITFSKKWDDLIRKLPNDKFIIETDCPYMTPEPNRDKRNEPVLVKHVAARIAEIKNLSKERIAEITTQNALDLFKI